MQCHREGWFAPAAREIRHESCAIEMRGASFLSDRAYLKWNHCGSRG
jgi:hypothetical protein